MSPAAEWLPAALPPRVRGHAAPRATRPELHLLHVYQHDGSANGFSVALIVAAIAVAILHFVRRAKMLRFTWNAMLWSAGLRRR